MPNQNPQSIKQKLTPKTDKEGFIFIGDFATQELKRQSKSVASFLDGEEGLEPEINFGTGLKFKGTSGNYSDMKIHIDDLEEFIKRVRNYYGD